MIRPATVEDLDALVSLEERCFEGDRLDRASLRWALNRQTALCLVEEQEGRVRGYVLLRSREGYVRILSLAVDPEARRQGVARALLQDAEQRVRELGGRELVLELREDNAGALALYGSLGFRQTATLLGYYHDRSDARRMTKSLHHEA